MWLPVAIQAHLAGTELTDIKELAQMADRLWLCHGPMPVATVEELQSKDNGKDVVAAIPAKKQFQRKQGGHPKDKQSSKGRKGQQVAGSNAREGKSLCWIHERHGKKARFCTDENSCTWLGS